MILLGFLAATDACVTNEIGTSNVGGAKFATIMLVIMTFHEALAKIFASSSIVMAKIHDLEIKHGNLLVFSYSSITVHFESNRPFVVVVELVMDIVIVKVVFPKGSSDIIVAYPFHVE
ncbi:hypothetical protein V6N13_106249 [Hibiscus sabdariffa]|uniref:Uncharacterized protein n=1 Tax=Hibiscus sabdariffa TaxID=183260 RepID=A0ABR2F040_9ROSI